MPNVSLLATMADQTASQIAGAASDILPTGTVLPFAGSSAPAGWLLCAGGEYLKTGTYAPLFAVIGVAYGETNGSGGVGTTHFRVPNCQGIFIAGSGSQAISGVTYTRTHGQRQGDAMQGHYHSKSESAHSHTYTQYGGGNVGHISAPVGSGFASPDSGNGSTASLSSTSSTSNLSITSPASDGSNGSPRTGAETRPANIAMNYIIKV